MSRARANQECSQRLGVGRTERGLSRLSPPQDLQCPAQGVAQRTSLEHMVGEGMAQPQEQGGLLWSTQSLSLLCPRLPSVTGYPILFPLPSGIQGLLSISQNAPGSHPLQGLHLFLSLPRLPSWSLWLSLASGWSNLHTVCVSEPESRLPGGTALGVMDFSCGSDWFGSSSTGCQLHGGSSHQVPVTCLSSITISVQEIWSGC